MRRLFCEYGLTMLALISLISGIGFFCSDYIDSIFNDGLIIWLRHLL